MRKNKAVFNNGSWVYKLWKWTDENNIPDLKCVEDKCYKSG